MVLKFLEYISYIKMNKSGPSSRSLQVYSPQRNNHPSNPQGGTAGEMESIVAAMEANAVLFSVLPFAHQRS